MRFDEGVAEVPQDVSQPEERRASELSLPALVRRCLSFVESGQRWRWSVLVGLALLVSVMEALTALMVFVMLGLVVGSESALSVPLLGDIEARFAGVSRQTLILWTGGAMAVVFVARAVVFGLQTYLQNRVAQNTAARLSARLFAGYLRLPYAFHLRRNSSELIRTAYSATADVGNQVFTPLVKLTSELLLVAGIVTVLLATAPLATLLSLAVLGPVAYAVVRAVQPRLVRIGAEQQEHVRVCLQTLQQSLEGVRDVKLFHAATYFGDLYRRERLALARATYLRGVFLDVPRVLMETALFLFIIGFLAVAILSGGTAASALSLLGLFAYAVVRVMPAVTRMISNANSLRFGAAAIDHVHEHLQRILSADLVAERPAAPLPFEERLALVDVSFRYEGADRDAVHGVDLVIEKGESIGVVGPTGGGKSTLLDLVTGLQQPTRGEVLVDGHDVRECVEAWQAQLGVVSQNVFLVDDTLRRNVAIGRADAEIDDEAVREAVELAQLNELVAELPEGLETLVGERGTRLSGGQRQRVAIARALYRRPNVVIFDEGTSALDSVTESEIIAALRRMHGRRTLIAIAHRLSTVRECDRILLIQAGRLIDQGTYEELLERNDDFRRLATVQ